jgi:hypothetical protein
LSAAWVEGWKNKDYYMSFIQENGYDDAFLIYMEQYFNNKKYNQPLGDLVPTMLSNALGLQIEIVQEDSSAKTTICSIKPNLNNNQTGIKVYIHLKNRHYSALEPASYFSKPPQTNTTPHDRKFCSNKFTALYDAPDTCIYAEESHDIALNSQDLITSSTEVMDNSNTNSINSHCSVPEHI